MENTTKTKNGVKGWSEVVGGILNRKGGEILRGDCELTGSSFLSAVRTAFR